LEEKPLNPTKLTHAMVHVGWDPGYFDGIDAPRSWFLKEKATPRK